MALGSIWGVGGGTYISRLLGVKEKERIKGAALSFVISNLCSLMYYVWYLQKNSQNIDLSYKYFLWDKQIIKEVFGIGISDFLMTSFLIVSSLLLNNFVVHYGDDVIVAFGVSLRIVQLPEFLCMGLFMGITPLIGYSYGAKNKERLQSAMKQTAAAIALIVCVFSSLVYIFRKEVLTWFTSSDGLIGIGIYILSVMLISTIFNGFTGLITSYFQATDKAKQALIMSISQGTLFIPTIIIANALLGLHGIIFSMTIAEFLTFLLGIFLYFYKKNSKFSGETAICE